MILPLGMNSVINDLIDSYLTRRLGDQWNIWLGCAGLIAGVLRRVARKKFGYPPETPEEILLLRLQTPKTRLSSESLGIYRHNPQNALETQPELVRITPNLSDVALT
jgi:hypothetical protein